MPDDTNTSDFAAALTAAVESAKGEAGSVAGEAAAAAPTPTAATTRTAPATPRSTGPAQTFTTNATNPALLSATLNAFSPQAPSKQMAGGSVSQPQSFMPTTPQPTAPGTPALAVQPAAPAATPTATGTSPLTGALAQKFAKPNQWWMLGGKQTQTV